MNVPEDEIFQNYTNEYLKNSHLLDHKLTGFDLQLDGPIQSKDIHHNKENNFFKKALSPNNQLKITILLRANNRFILNLVILILKLYLFIYLK